MRERGLAELAAKVNNPSESPLRKIFTLDSLPERPYLADIIQAVRLNGDKSYRELMDRAASFGHASKLSTWQQWGNFEFHRKLLPDPDTIRAFSRGMGVPETEVLMAAARQVGLDVGEGNATDLVLPGAGGLPPEDRNVLASLAAVLVAKGGG